MKSMPSMPNRRLNSNNEEPKTLSSNVYKTNHGPKCYFTNNFMSKSANRLLNDSEVLYVNHKVMNRFSNNTIKENSTQTSKTILQLAKIETESMSTDSRTRQPKDSRPITIIDSTETCSEHISRQYSYFTLDGFCDEPNNTFEQTRNFFGSRIPPSDLPKTVAEQTKCLEKSLATIFLEKAKQKLVHEKCNSSTNKDQIARRQSFKSKSFVEDYRHPNYVYDPYPNKAESSPKPRRHSWKNKVLIDLPDNSCLLRQYSSMCCKTPTTFMSPTTAFQIKNKMPEIQIINQLIPPTRRGRSTSPKVCSRSRDRRTKSKDRAPPYIDQSKTTLKSSSTTLVNLARDATIDEPKVNFEHNLGTIDEMSNTVKSSCGTNLSLITTGDYSSADNAICTALTKLGDGDWNVAVRGLAEIVELCRFVDLELIIGHMASVYRRLIGLLKSPRSYVCRIACQATGHLFEYVKDTRRPEFDDIVDLLLYKTADANKFIRHDANLALDCMVTHLPIFHSIRAVCSKGPLHKNPLVRTASARLLICAVVIASPDFVLNPNSNEFTRKRVFSNLGLFLQDKNLETRKFGERLYKVLCKEPRFEMYLRKYLNKEQCDKIKRNLKIVRRIM